MNILIKACALFILGWRIELMQNRFDKSANKRLEKGLPLSDKFVTAMSQKLYYNKLKFIKLQNKTDIAIAKSKEM
ncbi:MAG: hypothetical protein PUF72_00860 [Clostridiales bacterium]|nr:hypothetical protein [Clostridiales bacterium]